jgi:carbon starvation protein
VRGTEELEASGVRFNPGGAVAAASVFYLLLAVVMGIVQKLFAPPLWLVTLVFVPLTFAVSWLGTEVSGWLVFDARTWGLAILAYCALASVIPVWALLQPRGYLGGFVLYTALALGVIGVLFGGYELQQPAFTTFDTGKGRRTAVPVPVRHHRLRRVLGLPRSGVQRHDLRSRSTASRIRASSATARCWPRPSWL